MLVRLRYLDCNNEAICAFPFSRFGQA